MSAMDYHLEWCKEIMLNDFQLKSRLIDIIPVCLAVLTIIKQHDKKIITHRDACISLIYLSEHTYMSIRLLLLLLLLCYLSFSLRLWLLLFLFSSPKIMLGMYTSKNSFQKCYINRVDEHEDFWPSWPWLKSEIETIELRSDINHCLDLHRCE